MSRKPRKGERRPGVGGTVKPQSTPDSPVSKPPVVAAGNKEKQRDDVDKPIAHQNNKERPVMTYFEIIYLALTAGLLTTTVVLACFATDQLRLMRQQISQTQNTLDLMKIERRANCVFDTPKPDVGSDGKPKTVTNIGEELRFCPCVRNIGSTSAECVSRGTKFVVGPKDVDVTKEIHEAWQELGSRGGGGYFPPNFDVVGLPTKGITLTEELDRKINDGSLVVYYVNTLQYRDIFKAIHNTRATWVFDPGSNMFLISDNPQHHYQD